MERILIRHLTGSKANQIEQFPVENCKELLLGREQNASVTFDPEKDDLVSRRHALIQVRNEGKLSFTILDLNSSNGTFVNGTRISRESELVPEDVIELGFSGPKLVFDIEPRPAHFAARTRVMPRTDSPSTRVPETAVTGDTASTVTSSRRGLGRETVERLILQERRTASQLWVYGLAAMLAVIAAVGGILYYRNVIIEKRLEARAIVTESQLREKVGPMTLKDIAARYGDATVLINTTWRLYHKKSGKQVYHKFIENAPAYVQLADGKIVRWLVADDEKQTNKPIYKSGTGSGIVLEHDGFILTNKHVAAGWLTPYELASYEEEENCRMCGRLYRQNSDAWQLFNPTGKETREYLYWWRPGQEGYLFKEKKAEIIDSGAIDSGSEPFEARGDLDVQFPGQADRVQARLIRHSEDADVALVKIDIPYDLGTTARLADAKKLPALGEKIAILGYPQVSQKTQAAFFSFERGQLQHRQVDIPAPTVTEGVISSIGRDITQVEGRAFNFMYGSRGDVYQLSASGTGQGSSGGPILNSSGEVIGIFTYVVTNAASGDRVFLAVPIKYGKDLLQLQGKFR